jgi:hypothetical protein
MKRNYWKLLLVLVVFAGCKKETEQPAAPEEPEQPEQLISLIAETRGYPNNIATYNQEFHYDDQQRVKEIRESTGLTRTNRRVYTYINNKVELRVYDVNGVEQAILAWDYYLNSKGLVEQARNNYNGLVNVYEYNERDFLKKTRFFRDGRYEAFDTFSYSGNNILDSVCRFTATGEKGSASIYSYDQLKQNTTGNAQKGMKMFGRDQPFALTKETMFSYFVPGNIGKRLLFLVFDYANTYVNSERMVHSSLRRSDYTYPGPVISTMLYANYGYSYQ